MAISTITKNKRDGKLTFSDNAAAHSLEVAFEAGDFSLTIPGPTVSHYLDRGKITTTPSLRYVDDQPMTFSFTANLRDMSDATYATLLEIISVTGYVGTTWVSTMGATGEVFTLTLAWFIEGINHGDATNHTCTLNYCVVTGSVSEGDPNTISISGTAFDLYPTLV